jgi:aspartate kinase
VLIVKKFGGSSVADRDRVFNVASRIIEDYDKGHNIVVVLSAQGDTTDELVSKAKTYSSSPSKREMDMLLTTGEQISVSLMALALHELGYNAISLNASQVGMHTTSAYGNARLKNISSERINDELGRRNIVLVTGFQGINRYDDVTTLGRGGSDTTAVALAASLNADLCEIFTDVDGVYTADPRVVKNAKKIHEITYDEMLELASLGAKVLHNRSVEMAKKYGVELVVRSSITREEGTVVKEEVTVEKMLVSGVAADRNIARIAVVGIEDEPGKAFKLFRIMAKENINVDIILQSIGRNNTKDISFTVSSEDAQAAKKAIEEHKEALNFESVSVDDKVAKVSLVGAGMQSNVGVASKMFEALFDAGINIKMISTSEIKISLLIDEKYTEEAVNAIHEEFALGQ